MQLACLLAVLVCTSCSDDAGIEEKFFECRKLVEDKDSRQESLNCWTPASRLFVARLLDEKKTSSGTLSYLERYGKLLDYEEIVAIETFGDLALVSVVKGRLKETIVFERHNGEWGIDALELSTFWRELDDAVRIDR